MKKITEAFKGFFIRLKLKSLEKHEQFIITLIFTYLLTIIFTVLVVFNQFEDIMVSLNYSNSLWDFIKTTTEKFSFGYCQNVDARMYLAAKLFETLIPTTLTFSGTIFVLQTAKEKSNYLNAFLAIILLLVAMIGVFFMVSKLEAMLTLYMWMLLILFLLAILFSSKMFALQNKDSSSHKKEQSDGHIIG